MDTNIPIVFLFFCVSPPLLFLFKKPFINVDCVLQSMHCIDKHYWLLVFFCFVASVEALSFTYLGSTWREGTNGMDLIETLSSYLPVSTL